MAFQFGSDSIVFARERSRAAEVVTNRPSVGIAMDLDADLPAPGGNQNPSVCGRIIRVDLWQ